MISPAYGDAPSAQLLCEQKVYEVCSVYAFCAAPWRGITVTAISTAARTAKLPAKARLMRSRHIRLPHACRRLGRETFLPLRPGPPSVHATRVPGQGFGGLPRG